MRAGPPRGSGRGGVGGAAHRPADGDPAGGEQAERGQGAGGTAPAPTGAVPLHGEDGHDGDGASPACRPGGSRVAGR